MLIYIINFIIVVILCGVMVKAIYNNLKKIRNKWFEGGGGQLFSKI